MQPSRKKKDSKDTGQKLMTWVNFKQERQLSREMRGKVGWVQS